MTKDQLINANMTGYQQLSEIILSMNKLKSLPEVLNSLENLENVPNEVSSPAMN